MLTLDDVQSLSVSSYCMQSFICQHENTITLKDGRQSSLHNALDIYSVITVLANEKILVGEDWRNAEAVKEHFIQDKYQNDEDLETPENILNATFMNIKPVARRCSLL
jgi:hypothetical protein